MNPLEFAFAGVAKASILPVGSYCLTEAAILDIERRANNSVEYDIEYLHIEPKQALEFIKAFRQCDRIENELDTANVRVGLLESELADCRDGVHRV